MPDASASNARRPAAPIPDGTADAAVTVGHERRGDARHRGDLRRRHSTFNASDNVALPYSQKVNKAVSTTTLSSSANAAVLGQSVTFTVTIGMVAPGTGMPTGTVDFYDSGAKLGSGALSGHDG